MLYAQPGTAGAKVAYKSHYDNFIGGKWVAPTKNQYFDVITPITGKVYTKAARSTAEDIELALDAAHAAADAWGKTPAADRANVLLKIADRIEANLELLAYAETVDNGKAIRETLNADIPLTVDHFRYFAGALRGQEGGHLPGRGRAGPLRRSRRQRPDIRGQEEHQPGGQDPRAPIHDRRIEFPSRPEQDGDSDQAEIGQMPLVS